ncbi:hypothetical protein [Photobacterium kagoshimensis]|uniref:hypothetical protein n=1 Tax=Photobacterium kagoshimensis TaxID=2910242 RepID=UPI003D148FC5
MQSESFVVYSGCLFFKRLNDWREYSLVTAPTSVFGFNHGSAVAVDAPRTLSS